MNPWDVVIIGSGISSLTAAALLTKKGRSVCVLEKYSKPGGYLHCFNRFGHRFDTGAHYVGAMGPGQAFRTLLEYAGAYHDDAFVPLDSDGFDVMKFPDFSVELPRGYEETIERLSGVFPAEKNGIRGYFTELRGAAALFPTYTYNESADMQAIMPYLEKSLAQVVVRYVKDPRLQCVLFAYCALHGVDPEDVSFGLHAIMTDSLIVGAYGFSKGGDELAQRFSDVIEKRGGRVILRKKAAKIETRGGLATAVVTEDGERFEAKTVISGIHPKVTFDLIDDQGVFTPAFRERMIRMKESGGVFGVYAACRAPARVSPLKNYYFFRSEKPEDLLRHDAPGAKPFAAFLSCSNRLAKEGDSSLPLTIHASSPLSWFETFSDSRYGKRPDAYKKIKEDYARNIVGLVDAYQPGFENGVTQFVTSTPMTNLHFNGSIDGSSYGIYHSMENTGVRALGPRTHVANLLLTGQSCLFPGLLGAAVSALRTVGHVVGIKPLLKELREHSL